MNTELSFLFVTLEGGGNVPPMMGLASALQERGHRISFLAEPCMESTVRSKGHEFLAFKEHFNRADTGTDLFEDTVSPKGEMATMENVVFGPARVTFNETLQAVDAVQPHVLVVDALLPPALMAAELRGISRAVIFHLPEYLPGPGRPPGMLGLKPGKSAFGKLRDHLLGKLWTKKLNDFLPKINDIRRENDLPPLSSVIDLLHKADLRLITTLKDFDFPIDPAPKNVRYCGPIIDDPYWADKWQNPWSNNDDPLVVVGMSSTFMSQADAINHCIEALNEMQVRGLVTTGPAIDPAQFKSTDKVKVVRAVPHSAVFPFSSAVITHAGHGTVMRALAHGLPMVCMPMGRDQKDNAVKVEHHGCGVRLDQKAKPETIRKAVEKVLQDPKYRTHAELWQQRIHRSSGAATAADALVQLGSHAKKVAHVA